MIVTIRKKLEPLWGTAEELQEMPDKDIIEMLWEDTCQLLEGAEFILEREEGEVNDEGKNKEG